VVPPLRDATILRSWAGFEAETPDHWPIAGGFRDHPHLFAAVPAKAGFTAGALVGRLTAERVLSGETSPLALPMDPDRFQDGGDTA
jgi:sarcosine oxidase subunit beta